MPSQTEYFVGDTLDTTGLQLTATNTNGTTEQITNGFTCSPMTLDSSGTQTITVSYGGKTAYFSVSVQEASWSVIGSFSGSDWATDFPMRKIEENVYASTAIQLNRGDELKVRRNSSWDVNYGGDGLLGGSNFVVPRTGTYLVYLTITEDKYGYILLSRVDLHMDDILLVDPYYLFMSPGQSGEIEIWMNESRPDTTLWFYTDGKVSAEWTDWGGRNDGPIIVYANMEGYSVLTLRIIDNTTENIVDEVQVGIYIQ